VVIDRGIEEVFDFLMDAENNASWQPGVVSARQTTPGFAEIGTQVEEQRELLGYRFSARYEIVAISPPFRCDVRSAAGPLTFRASYVLDEVHDGTLVELIGDMGRCRLPGVVGPLVGQVVKRELAASAGRLKRRLEAPAETPAETPAEANVA
jgi:carbon monoxide dehydrogenase subunit G